MLKGKKLKKQLLFIKYNIYILKGEKSKKIIIIYKILRI
jgi:hypothetical protein